MMENDYTDLKNACEMLNGIAGSYISYLYSPMSILHVARVAAYCCL